MSERFRVVVMGQGYVGLPLSMRAVEAGHTVTAYDLDLERVAHLQHGESYIVDVPSSRLQAALATGRMRPTAIADECRGFDVAIVAVPTPLRDGLPDLRHVEAAARTIAPFIRVGSTVVLESTTYPGTTENIVAPLLNLGSNLSAGSEFFLGYSPERIDPGNREWRLENTPKVVSGIGETSLTMVDRFYQTLVESTVRVSSPRIAELSKLLENTFRHINIALVNELAIFSHEMDLDLWEAIEAAGSKPFGFMRFDPGPGVGGHCLPIDPSYLAWGIKRSLGRSFRFVELANDINAQMPEYVVSRIVAALNDRALSVKGAKVLLLGLAYKKNVGDARESPAARVAELLLESGAILRIVDPHVIDFMDSTFARAELTEGEVLTADIVVLLTDHDAFDLGLLTRSKYVLDCRHRLRPSGNVEML